VLADRRCGFRAVTVHPIAGSDHRAVLAEVLLPRDQPLSSGSGASSARMP